MNSVVAKLGLLGSFAILTACGPNASQNEITAAVQMMTAPAAVQIALCEVPETPQHNPYTGQGRYSLALCASVIEVTLRLHLTGDCVTDYLHDRYKSGIEQAWNTDRFEVPIQFIVIWTDEDADWTIKVNPGVGRFWTCTWYTAGRIEDAAAHEVGHFIGLYDEYGVGDAQGWDGGAAPGPRPRHPVGLMQNSHYPTLDYYYDGIMAWYYGRDAEIESDRLERLIKANDGRTTR